ncbi:MAG: hypothetical protein JFR38_07855 [Muribaculaceae bacterium]|nr:hypothetical protein [Muribaculaceae bacterium]
MKLFKIALLAAVVAAPAAAWAQVPPSGMPGIAVAGSVNDNSLPASAREFISKYYPGQSPASVEKNFIRNDYDVRLVNGVEMEFNSKGSLSSIEAPDGTVLPDAVVKALLPDKAYRHLVENGLAGYVDEIELGRRGFEVGLLLPDPDEVVYTIEGEFISFDD